MHEVKSKDANIHDEAKSKPEDKKSSISGVK